jgi:hypothetical protein
MAGVVACLFANGRIVGTNGDAAGAGPSGAGWAHVVAAHEIEGDYLCFRVFPLNLDSSTLIQRIQTLPPLLRNNLICEKHKKPPFIHTVPRTKVLFPTLSHDRTLVFPVIDRFSSSSIGFLSSFVHFVFGGNCEMQLNLRWPWRNQ